jgi:hypothetical protein
MKLSKKLRLITKPLLNINNCLQAMLLNRHQLAVIGESDLTAIPVSLESEASDISPNSTIVSDSAYIGNPLAPGYKVEDI